jgi:hypothetical protein
VAAVSGLEVVGFRHAHRNGLMRDRLPEDVYRWGAVASLSPVVFFLLSIPVAFLNPTLAIACWFLAIPFGLVMASRWEPDRAKRYLGS